jgi:hypothetical protein
MQILKFSSNSIYKKPFALHIKLLTIWMGVSLHVNQIPQTTVLYTAHGLMTWDIPLRTPYINLKTTHSKILVSALKCQVRWGDTNDEVVDP